MPADKFANVTVLSDYENVSASDRLGIKGLRFQLFWRRCWERSVSKAMVFEADIPALSLIEHGVRINYDAASEQLS